jgi:hypothetical protein
MASFGTSVLATSQTGNFTTTAGVGSARQNGGAIVITNVAGATPTVTANIQGSVDGTNWYNIPYALVATPTTYVLTAITITTAATVIYLLQPSVDWDFVQVVFTANTNETLTVTAHV